MRRLHPADELAEIRAEIARLHRRERDLEALIVNSPDAARTGLLNTAEVTETRRRVLDPALLPPDLHADPTLWREDVTQTVAIVPTRSRALPLRPGWPISRAPQAAMPQPAAHAISPALSLHPLH